MHCSAHRAEPARDLESEVDNLWHKKLLQSNKSVGSCESFLTNYGHITLYLKLLRIPNKTPSVWDYGHLNPVPRIVVWRENYDSQRSRQWNGRFGEIFQIKSMSTSTYSALWTTILAFQELSFFDNCVYDAMHSVNIVWILHPWFW